MKFFIVGFQLASVLPLCSTFHPVWLVLVEALDGMSKVHNQFSETFDTLHKELSEYHQSQKDRFKKNVSALGYVCYTCVYVHASSSSCICNYYLYICDCTISAYLYIHTYTDIHISLSTYACVSVYHCCCVCVCATTYIWTRVFVHTSILHTCSIEVCVHVFTDCSHLVCPQTKGEIDDARETYLAFEALEHAVNKVSMHHLIRQ